MGSIRLDSRPVIESSPSYVAPWQSLVMLLEQIPRIFPVDVSQYADEEQLLQSSN
jgi:hypothetical protein